MISKIKSQQGYLMVVAAFLVVVIGFFASAIAYMFMGGMRASTNVLQSNTAFYIALSGLEMAKRAILISKNTCSSINTTFVNVTFPLSGSAIGNFTVTGTSYSYSSQLSGGITSNATSITVGNASGFAVGGVEPAKIDSEIITYANIVSNTLQGVRRGVAGTVAASHLSTASVVQNACVLRSAGQVATLASDGTSAIGRRVLQESISMGTGGPLSNNLPGLPIMPAAVSASGIIVDDPSVAANPNGCELGCALVAAGGITDNDPGNVTCTAGCNATIAYAGDTNITTDSNGFYNYFFNQSVATMEASGYDATANMGSINNIITSGQPGYGDSVVYYNGNLILPAGNYLTTAPAAYPGTKTLIANLSMSTTAGVTIGSINNPVIIISPGPFNANGGIIYGFIYGGSNVELASNTILYGAVASVGGLTINSAATINFTQQVYSELFAPSATTVQGISEVFS